MSEAPVSDTLSARLDDDCTEPRRAVQKGGPPLNVVMAWVFELLTLSAAEPHQGAAERERRRSFLRRALASPTPEVREFARVAARGLAEIGAHVGRLTDIGGGGLGISTLHPLPVGHRTSVRLEDIDSGVSYEFPCVVVWSRLGADPGIGVCFWGKPSREYRG
jgi:hypothetical protein